jgi:hypothetical protein
MRKAKLHQRDRANNADTDENARITTGLRKGARYQVQIRTVFADADVLPRYVVE